MKRLTGYLPFLSILLGLVGLFLRRWQLNTCFDELGLPVSGAAVVLLTLFSVAVYLFFCGSALSMKGKTDWSGALGDSPMPVLILPAVLTAAAALRFVSEYHVSLRASTPFPAAQYLLPVLMVTGCLAAALALLLIARGGKPEPLMVMLPGFTSCFWMVNAYRTHAANPVVLRFGWFLLAVVFCSLAWCRIAALSMNTGRTSSTLRACLVAVFFSVIGLAGGESSFDTLLLLANAVSLSMFSLRMVGRM